MVMVSPFCICAKVLLTRAIRAQRVRRICFFICLGFEWVSGFEFSYVRSQATPNRVEACQQQYREQRLANRRSKFRVGLSCRRYIPTLRGVGELNACSHLGQDRRCYTLGYLLVNIHKRTGACRRIGIPIVRVISGS